jgi:phosphoribosylformylglycinamidine synthase subunit PurQ / glutaminase
LERLEGEGQIVFRYADADGNISADANPNGSEQNIAGIINDGGNVLGMMPHPERACSPLLGSNDGVRLLESILARVAA